MNYLCIVLFLLLGDVENIEMPKRPSDLSF